MTDTDMTTHAADALRIRLAQHTGTDNYWRHPFNKTSTYTDGVRAFVQSAGHSGAYWLLDIVMTEPGILRSMRSEGIVFIELDVKDCAAELVCKRDTEGPFYYRRKINPTDCPEGLWRFYFCADVLMLPSEY